MSWSHYESGPALEVARKVEVDAEPIQKYLQGEEKGLHARVVGLIVVACHAMKGKHISVQASGHAGGHYDGPTFIADEQNLKLDIHPIQVQVPEMVDVQGPAVVEPEPVMLQEPVSDLKIKFKKKSKE